MALDRNHRRIMPIEIGALSRIGSWFFFFLNSRSYRGIGFLPVREWLSYGYYNTIYKDLGGVLHQPFLARGNPTKSESMEIVIVYFM